MADNFKAGDVVQLKSGGPLMTVAKVEGDRVICDWFDKGKREVHGFNSSVLMKAEAGGPEVIEPED